MRIGVYNRWLHVLGGGERHMLSLAQVLAKQHTVHVLSQHRVGPEEIKAKLCTDTANIQFDVWPNLPDEALAPWTEPYDLFINASHMGFVPPRARASALLVYFPVWSGNAWWQPTLGWLAQHLARTHLMAVDYLEGFDDVPQGKVLLREKGRLTLSVPLSSRRLRFRAVVTSLQGGQAPMTEFYLDGKRLVPGDTRQAVRRSTVYWFQLNPTSRRCGPLELEVRLETPGRAIIRVQVRDARYWLYSLLFERLVPGGWARVLRIPPVDFQSTLDRYTRIWAISRFTQDWIRTYWKRESDVLYPAADMSAFAPLKKQNVILSVGRFFVGGHNKKQLEMVRAFKYLCARGLQGWELHLAGGTSPGPRHQLYLARVQTEARGYPVFFHLDTPFETLQRLYGQAKIYWHASGHGEDVCRHPDRFEHFGITTVEAMAAGCVPVVIGKAGQREIVVDGTSGFLWHRLDELVRYTWRLIQDPALWEKMSQGARRRSRGFGKDAFARRVRALVSQLDRYCSR